MTLRVTTKSGSIYEVNAEDRMIRAVKRTGDHRIVPEWKPYDSIHLELHHSMVVFWGRGRDEFSPDDGLPDEARTRHTWTSQVVDIGAA